MPESDDGIPQLTSLGRGGARPGSGRKRNEDQHKSIEDYHAARAMREKYEALLSELEFNLKSGALLDANVVQKQTFELARKARDALLAIPDRVSPILAGEDDAKIVHELLTKEIRQVCEELSGGRGSQPLQ